MNIEVMEKGPQFDMMSAFIASQAPNICKGKVRHTYIREQSISGANMMVVAYTAKKGTRSLRDSFNIHGFAFIKKTKSVMYIDVICGIGVGKRILHTIYNKARALNIKCITLSALPHVINFYRKEGFIHAESCKSETEIIRVIAEANKSLRFKDMTQAMSDKAFRKLLSVLVKYKLTSNKSCKNISSCSIDGYVMSKKL